MRIWDNTAASGETTKSCPFLTSAIFNSQDYSSDACLQWRMCSQKIAPGSWSGIQRLKNQYISKGKLFFVLSQTTAATFPHIKSLTKQITTDWQQGFFGNSTGEWVVTLGSLLIIVPPGLLLIPKYEIFIAQDGGNGCSHPAFQKKRKLAENICRSHALTRMLHLPRKNVFLLFNRHSNPNNSQGFRRPTGLKIIAASGAKEDLWQDYHRSNFKIKNF